MTNNAGQPWLPAADDKLVRMCKEGESEVYMAQQLGRTVGSIQARLEKTHNLFSYEHLKSVGWLDEHIYTSYGIKAPGGKLPEPPTPTMLPMGGGKTTLENTMNTTVTTKTYIGNREASDLSVEEVVTIIEQEQAFIERLIKLTMSDARDKLIKKHKKNLVLLEKVLEEKVND